MGVTEQSLRGRREPTQTPDTHQSSASSQPWLTKHLPEGKQGSIYTWGDGKSWVLYASCKSARSWTTTKRRLAFCKVTQDGDDEGRLRVHQLPTTERAD